MLTLLSFLLDFSWLLIHYCFELTSWVGSKDFSSLYMFLLTSLSFLCECLWSWVVLLTIVDFVYFWMVATYLLVFFFLFVMFCFLMSVEASCNFLSWFLSIFFSIPSFRSTLSVFLQLSEIFGRIPMIFLVFFCGIS